MLNTGLQETYATGVWELHYPVSEYLANSSFLAPIHYPTLCPFQSKIMILAMYFDSNGFLSLENNLIIDNIRKSAF